MTSRSPEVPRVLPHVPASTRTGQRGASPVDFNAIVNSFAASQITAATPTRCECDYDCEGDPLEYVKTSRYCPVHDNCENCMERKGVMKDPHPAPTDKRPWWLCAECAKLCNECGNNPCTCAEPEVGEPLMTPAQEREFSRGFNEAHTASEER